MAVDSLVHVNESGLPLNAIEWLETHHRSKAPEREQMIRDLHLKKGSYVVDAGCGPGLWTPLLARAIGQYGSILGVDISPASLVTAHRRSQGKWYHRQVQYKQGTLEQLPIQPGSADIIFSANVSQYLSDPVAIFAALGQYLVPGGRLAIKDIDFGTMRFHNVDGTLQARVFQARERWERIRVKEGIAEWFVCEGAPLLETEYHKQWLQQFLNGELCVLDKDTFVSEETEFVVTGVWKKSPPTAIRYIDRFAVCENA